MVLPRELLVDYHVSSLGWLGYDILEWKDRFQTDPPPPPPPPDVSTAGVFLTRANLDRAKQRAAGNEEPFAAIAKAHRATASRLLSAGADTFQSPDMSKLIHGWSFSVNKSDNSVFTSVKKLENGSNPIRRLAMEYALSQDTQFADKAVELMRAFATNHQLLNFYDFHPKFENGGDFDGKSPEPGIKTDRPWNFGLSMTWQTYGVVNMSDAYMLLTRNGYVLSADDDATLRAWILKLAEALNSGFHAWTRWADANPRSRSLTRYRTDNHLSWCQVGLLSAAAALGDAALGNYVLRGGSWTDSRAGAYRNPSHIRDVIDRAIEAGDDLDIKHEGRVYEELIGRGLGYALFHLKAMGLVAQIARVNFSDDIWNFVGADNGGIRLGLNRYAAFILGERQAPDGKKPSGSFTYELAYAQWKDPRFAEVIKTTKRSDHFNQAIGPVSLLVGESLPS